MVSSSESVGSDDILGRAEELAALRRFVAEVPAGPASFVVEGDPGIGKTMLWRAAVEAAREASCCVLVCRPAGSEVRLAFAALGDLLEEVLDDALPALPVPQRRALEVALLLVEPSGPPPEQRAIALAVLSVLRMLASTRPVVLAIDDAQWIDRSTGAILEFALRRLRREPIALLAALRIESGEDGRFDLADVLQDGRRFRLRVGPLSVGAVHRLVRARLGLALSRPLLLRLHKVSGGNPFYALELARALRRTDDALDPADRLPLTARLRDLVQQRLAALPASVQDVVLAAAALSVPSVSAVQAVMPEARVRSRLATAAAEGVLEVDGDRIVFAHPLLAAGVYSAADPVHRRRLHRRLAAIVSDEEEQARHLALATVRRRATVASTLDRAARRASNRGAPHAAAELFELAARATPADAVGDVRRRRLDAADAHVSSGAIGRARAIVQGLLEELPPGDERAAVLLRAARAAADLRTQADLAERALREATDDRVLAAAHLVVGATWPEAGMAEGLRHARLALEHAERAGDTALVARALTRLAHWELWAGQTTDGLLERALASKRVDHYLGLYEDPRMPLALRRMYQGHLDEAHALFRELQADAKRAGDEIGLVAVWGRLVDVELRAGEWQRAARHAELAYEHADQIGLDHDGGFTVYWRALVSAHLGSVDDCRRAAELGVKLAETARSQNTRVMNLGVLGLLELSRGNPVAARDHLTPALDWVVAKQLGLATLPVAPYAIEAVLGAGDLDRAQELIARFGREARQLDSPWALAIAARCRGIAAAAGGDLGAALADLERASSIAAEGGWPFEHARTLLALGSTQRRARQKRAARESLEAALLTFQRLGAPLWGEQAQRELRSIGGRPPSGDRLTSTEERVAGLVAEGRTNHEVAATLYIAERTVEGHLTRIYAKLGVHSRAELAHRLAVR